MTPPELVATYWTIGGNCRPSGGPDEVSPFDFRDRVETARKVGYRGIGFAYADIMAVSDRIGFDTMKAVLDDNDMKHVEVENIFDWFTSGERRRRSDVIRRDLMNAAKRLGARHIKIGGDFENEGRTDWSMEHLAREFRQLCDEAAEVGAGISLEIMPFTNLRTIDQGLELLRRAGAPNGGIMIDIWHMGRGGIDYDDVARIPKDALSWVEVNDALDEVQGSLFNDTVNHRVLPGEGALRFRDFLRAIQATGYDGPYGVEILSDEHRLLPLDEAASRAFDATMKEFESVERETAQ
ncbi:sugar phosphate isomerase/epimerase family protein [Bauldia sp.]|uniref:sugar phosphate isomerase/epimerase family protein n=1 Tax=Bauldia sp. TaxID=2575872 RepID=UPI003BA9FC7B